MIHRIMLLICSLLCTTSAIAQPHTATPVSDITAQPGFKVELLRSAQDGESSWISMSFDTKGNIILGLDDVGVGHLDMTEEGDEIPFTRLNNSLKHCRGVLYAHDSIYVSATNSQGFYRLQDTTGDGAFDKEELLLPLEYKSRFGHGMNQITLGPDKQIYLICGNDVVMPGEITKTSTYKNARKDWLLPNPHDAGQDDRVGYILRMDPDGKLFHVIAGGLRNQVDLAFNAEDEMFTFDADMEWDVGQPWYRPTRINHIVPGGEYGWRWGTGKWPTYYADSLPSTLDLGLGSPTGMVSGHTLDWPKRFQQGMYAADWQNGRILLVDLIPVGATYRGEYELFLEGAPLNICDMDVGADGNLYFITGGRGSQSGLYRVTVDPSTEPTSTGPKFNRKLVATGEQERNQRKIYDSFQERVGNTSDREVWPALGSDDRWLRFSAMKVLERQPVQSWSEKVLDDDNPLRCGTGLIALCRSGVAQHQPQVFDALQRFDLPKLNLEQQLIMLRAYQLCFLRLGKPTEKQTQLAIEAISPLFPGNNESVNHMAGELLVYLKMPGIIESSIPLLAEDSTQYQQLRMARMLMHLREGWTEDTKTAFLNWLLQSRRMTGGRQLNERLTDIRTDFYELLTEGDKSTHARLIEKIEQPIESGELTTSRPLVQQWKMEDLTKDISAVSSNRPDEDGLRALTAANCLKCHKVGNRGGQIGPDLTNVAKRFNASQILESIIEPSKEVDPKYSYSVYLLIDGTSVSGRPVGVTSKTLKLEINPFTQESIEINRDEIDESFPGKTSPMPSGLLDTLNKEEIKDLLAYLIRAAAQ
tara:strand:- start:274 stop:2715 length:2442 start_codon:yes stop_codon:yes gene_type:complete